ncbi:oxidoreductase [Bacillus sp. FJAT-27225]|uniref:Gfo/Idh/MocA family protein n=1 Tax=Bacillus sp. FJAT-27225 TaxID=1743144 RepID=UPI00080C3090|nr:Gfo/Idh/MocA family oxidoreductase [Bacillus sp. FJAT-27225]OCA83359.1 oxidoreductase [Bacillus sp. FJAT-27225]
MKLATIGTSWITEAFISAALLSGKHELTAVYSRSEKKASEFAAKTGAPNYYTNLEEMTQSPDIDAVYIASPNSEHFRQALLFLKNKKHVICEKPIFSNSKELEEAFRAADENGVYLFEAIRNIHSPNLEALNQELHRAGTLRSAVLAYMKYSSRYDLVLKGEEPNIFSSKYSGGALMDLGVYTIHLAVSLFGKPEKVSYAPVMLPTGVDGSGTMVLSYPGFVCTIMCSKISDSTIPCEIHGEKGTFIIGDAAPISSIDFLDRSSGEKISLGSKPADEDMVYEAARFASIIENKEDEAYAALQEQSRYVLGIIDEARRQNGIVFQVEKK